MPVSDFDYGFLFYIIYYLAICNIQCKKINNCIRAVSYTHLDVYKRQYHKHAVVGDVPDDHIAAI